MENRGFEGPGPWYTKTLRVNVCNRLLAFADFLVVVVWFFVLVHGTTPEYVMDLDHEGGKLGHDKLPLRVCLTQL